MQVIEIYLEKAGQKRSANSVNAEYLTIGETSSSFSNYTMQEVSKFKHSKLISW